MSYPPTSSFTKHHLLTRRGEHSRRLSGRSLGIWIVPLTSAYV